MGRLVVGSKKCSYSNCTAPGDIYDFSRLFGLLARLVFVYHVLNHSVMRWQLIWTETEQLSSAQSVCI